VAVIGNNQYMIEHCPHDWAVYRNGIRINRVLSCISSDEAKQYAEKDAALQRERDNEADED